MGDLIVGILVFVAIVIGWLLGKAERKKTSGNDGYSALEKNYYDGLNLLLNEQEDEAIDLLLRTLDLNGDTFETYMVVGSLYRRRGEVDRAIGLHQDVLARTSITRLQQGSVKLELARDYLKAGVLDRAERLLKEIAEDNNPNQGTALELLLSIFEQEKEWDRAITTAERLVGKGQRVEVAMSHYYCELAQANIRIGDYTQARRELKLALQKDKGCVRANLHLAEVETQTNNPKDAIKALRRIADQDPAYIPDTLALLKLNYDRLGQKSDLAKFLFGCLEKSPSISTVIALSDLVAELEGQDEGNYVLAEYLKKRPTIKGLDRLIHLQMAGMDGKAREHMEILRSFTRKLIKDKPNYRCDGCGYESKSLYWQCPSCKTWGSVSPIRGLEGE